MEQEKPKDFVVLIRNIQYVCESGKYNYRDVISALEMVLEDYKAKKEHFIDNICINEVLNDDDMDSFVNQVRERFPDPYLPFGQT